mgnify:FL=1
MSDDDMTAEEFDRRLAEATPVDVTVNLGRTYTRISGARPALVASRERVAEVVRTLLVYSNDPDYPIDEGDSLDFADRLLAAGVFRDEAEVKAEGAKRAIDEIDSWMSTADDDLYDEWVLKRGAVRAANGVAS